MTRSQAWALGACALFAGIAVLVGVYEGTDASQVRADVANAPKGVVSDHEDESTPLPISLASVKRDVSKIVCGTERCDNDAIELRDVGIRYILFSEPRSTGFIDSVLDTTTLRSDVVGDGWSTTTDNGVLYIGSQAVTYYQYDAPGSVLIAGSKLTDGETYDSGGDMPSVRPVETHTNATLTIGVFAQGEVVSGAQTPNYKLRLLRVATLPIPSRGR